MKRLLYTIIVLTVTFAQANSQKQLNNPKANPSAVVITDNARFTILTSELIRMEWSESATFEDRASLIFINRNLPSPEFRVEELAGWIIIKTNALMLRYRKGTGKFQAENLVIKRKLNNEEISWQPGVQDSSNLLGTTRTLDGKNGGKDVELEQGILSRGGWTFIDDSKSLLFDSSDWNWVIPRPEGERQDWYFFGHGHDYKKALYDFTQVAGKIPIPPKYAFGYWWSRYWTYSDAELRQLVSEMKHYNVPIDVLIIDMDWHETWELSASNYKLDPFGELVGWTGYTWNRNLFPEPERFLQWTEQQGLKTALNLHPASGIAPMEERYREFAKAYGFDTTGRHYIPFAMDNKKWAQTYFNVILRPIEKQGVDFWWIDWQQWLENKAIKGLSNTWWLNYTFFTNMERREDKRPLLFHRWGGLGNHRYQIGFSGDTYVTWESLAFQPYFTATASNVGYGYWSHDIGGHQAGKPNSEMYLRWLQWGAFSPILRTHFTKTLTIDRRIWKHDEYFELMRDAIQFRYQLVPYIYTAAREAYDTGVSICRPMYYDYPESQEAYDFKDQYMFGKDMLIAPITEKVSQETGQALKLVWLPEGTWYKWFSGSIIKGGYVVERNYSLNEIPLFVKTGSIIPMIPKRSNLQQRIDTLVLTIIPGGKGETRIYEDDGATSEYKKDQFTFTKVTKTIIEDTAIQITVFPREGSYKNIAKTRAYEFRFPCMFPPTSVMVNEKKYPYSTDGKSGTWTYDGSQLAIIVQTPNIECTEWVDLALSFAQNTQLKLNLLNGKIGIMSRLPKIVELMTNEVNRHDWCSNVPTIVLRAGSLASRITYRPERTIDLLEEFERNYKALLREIMDYPNGDSIVLKRIIAQFPDAQEILPCPKIEIATRVAWQPTMVKIFADIPGMEIRYTIDGSNPNESSSLYSAPFIIDSTSIIKARSFKSGFQHSFMVIDTFQRIWAKSVRYEFPNNPRYNGGGPFALVNGRNGFKEDLQNDWVSFPQVDFVATIELLNPTDLKSITARFLKSQVNQIFLPTNITYEVSTDGKSYESVFNQDLKVEAETQDDEVKTRVITAAIDMKEVTHIRVKAKNIGSCPPWHRKAGDQAQLFIDEISIE